MSWIAIAQAVLGLVPAIISAIKAIEELFPESGKGVEKLDLIRGILETINEQSKELWPIIEKVVGVVVSFCNAMGIFKTTKKEGE